MALVLEQHSELLFQFVQVFRSLKEHLAREWIIQTQRCHLQSKLFTFHTVPAMLKCLSPSNIFPLHPLLRYLQVLFTVYKWRTRKLMSIVKRILWCCWLLLRKLLWGNCFTFFFYVIKITTCRELWKCRLKSGGLPDLSHLFWTKEITKDVLLHKAAPSC